MHSDKEMREYFADLGLDKKIEEYAKAQKADIKFIIKEGEKEEYEYEDEAEEDVKPEPLVKV